MGEFTLKKLKELNCDFLSGFAFKSKDYEDDGIPIIKIGNIQNRVVSIDLSGNFFPEHKVTDKISAYLLNDCDVLIAMTGQGSVGRVGKLRKGKNDLALLNQRVGKFITDEKNLNIDYLYYVLTSDTYQEYLFNTGTGSGQPNLSPSVILETEIPATSYSEQKAIASVLSSLDDKIDLLHRQNQTLEALAETLFRQWFVERRPELVEGEAEEDWEEEPLSEIANFLNGEACQKYPPKNPVEKLPVLKIKELKNGISDSSDWASTDVGEEYIVENGDIIFSWSASLLVKIWDGETSILNQHLFKVTSDRFPKWFYYLWSKSSS
jgi:type I restriction enzyme S subunit